LGKLLSSSQHPLMIFVSVKALYVYIMQNYFSCGINLCFHKDLRYVQCMKCSPKLIVGFLMTINTFPVPNNTLTRKERILVLSNPEIMHKNIKCPHFIIQLHLEIAFNNYENSHISVLCGKWLQKCSKWL